MRTKPWVTCQGGWKVIKSWFPPNRESNHTATALATLFKAWRNAVEADREMDPGSRRDTHVQEFVQKYQLTLSDDGKLENVLSRDLFVALKGVARWYTLPFAMDSVQQFTQRFTNDLDTIRQAGFRNLL